MVALIKKSVFSLFRFVLLFRFFRYFIFGKNKFLLSIIYNYEYNVIINNSFVYSIIY
jgi:hypothetical protein